MKRIILLLMLMAIVMPVCAYSTLHLNSSLTDLGGHTWTNRNSTPYNTSAKVLGSASIQFTKTSYRSIDTPTYSDFNFTTNDFTVDFYFNPQAGGATADNGGVFTLSSGTVRSPLLILENASTMKAYSSSDGSNWDVLNGESLGTTTANTWAHYAVVRSGNTFSMYQNGVLQSTVTSSASLMDSSTVAWGRRGWAGGDNFVTGLLDEARVTQGARWATAFTPPTTEENYTYIYSNAGTFTFTCPAGFTNGTVTLIGAGGSGKGGSDGQYAGGGGFAGERKTYAKIATTPGTGYTIVVGDGGHNVSYGAASNAGGASTAFTRSSAGGLGGITLPLGVYNGGDGAVGYLSQGRLATNGTNTTIHNYGIGGLGWGAGGGGGSYDAVAPLDTAGGHGAPGYVSISNYADYTGNIPQFVADDTQIPYGTVVRFTDLSTITDSSGLTYNWSFGDGESSNAVGNVQHVYAYMGSFDVSLTINSASGEIVETKSAYISVTAQEPSELDLKTDIVPTSFTLVDRRGAALKNIAVTAIMTGTSSNGTNWFQTLLGIDDTATSVNTTLMSDLTDDQGVVVFPMISAAKYHLTFTNASQGVSDAKDIHPTQNAYIILLASTATATPPNLADSMNITLRVSPPPETNPATVYLIANYTDSSSLTTNTSFWVRHATNQTVIYNTYSGSPNAVNAQYGITNTAGNSYVWGVNATSSRYGLVTRASGITMKGTGTAGLASNLLKVCNNWECT